MVVHLDRSILWHYLVTNWIQRFTAKLSPFSTLNAIGFSKISRKVGSLSKLSRLDLPRFDWVVRKSTLSSEYIRPVSQIIEYNKFTLDNFTFQLGKVDFLPRSCFPGLSRILPYFRYPLSQNISFSY